MRFSLSRAGIRLEVEAGVYALLAGAAVALLIVMLAALWLRRRRPAGAAGPSCGRCGYGVTGLPSAVCPECGSDLRDVGVVASGAADAGGAAACAAWTLAAPLVALLGGVLVAEYALPRSPDPTGALPYVHPVWFWPAVVVVTGGVWWAGARGIRRRGRTGGAGLR
jgi:hypothetical protein